MERMCDSLTLNEVQYKKIQKLTPNTKSKTKVASLIVKKGVDMSRHHCVRMI